MRLYARTKVAHFLVATRKKKTHVLGTWVHKLIFFCDRPEATERGVISMANRDELEKAMASVREHQMSADERDEQRRSFVYGNTKIEYDCLTRDAVDEIAKRQASSR